MQCVVGLVQPLRADNLRRAPRCGAGAAQLGRRAGGEGQGEGQDAAAGADGRTDGPLIMRVSSTRLQGTMNDRRSGRNTFSPGEAGLMRMARLPGVRSTPRILGRTRVGVDDGLLYFVSLVERLRLDHGHSRLVRLYCLRPAKMLQTKILWNYTNVNHGIGRTATASASSASVVNAVRTSMMSKIRRTRCAYVPSSIELN